MQICDMVTLRDVTRSQVKCETNEAFQAHLGAVFSVGKRSFCWCGLTFLLTFKNFNMQKNMHKTPKEKKRKKHNRVPLNILSLLSMSVKGL